MRKSQTWIIFDLKIKNNNNNCYLKIFEEEKSKNREENWEKSEKHAIN